MLSVSIVVIFFRFVAIFENTLGNMPVNPCDEDIKKYCHEVSPWLQVFDDSVARQDWGWHHTMDMPDLVEVMITNLRNTKSVFLI